MNTTRFYEVTDEEIITGFTAYFCKLELSNKLIEQYCENHGFKAGKLERPGFGLWGFRLAGIEVSQKEFSERDDRFCWTQPKKNLTRPKKNSELWGEYLKLCEAVNFSGKDIDELLGWTPLDFFPARPGFHFLNKGENIVFKMPSNCDSLKGCKEISNIEYLEWCKAKDSHPATNQ